MYKCIKCQYETKVKANYEKHLVTIKHLDKVYPESVIEQPLKFQYLYLYNKTKNLRKKDKKELSDDYALWIELNRKLNKQLLECYLNYNLKRDYWKPLKSKCLLQMAEYINQKRIIKWNKRNELIDMYLHKDIWRTRMVYLLVDIRDILGRPII